MTKYVNCCILLFLSCSCFGQDFLIIPSTYSETSSKHLLMLSENLMGELAFENKKFNWKAINLSYGNADLLSCCETKVTSWQKNELTSLLDSIGNQKYDSLGAVYANISKGLHKFLKRNKKKILGSTQFYFKEKLFYVLKVKILICNCQYQDVAGNSKLPLGKEAIVKKFYHFRKLKKHEVSFFKKNSDEILTKIPVGYVFP